MLSLSLSLSLSVSLPLSLSQSLSLSVSVSLSLFISVSRLMSSEKRQEKEHLNGGENLGAQNVRRVKAAMGCSMFSVGNPAEIC